MEAILEPAGEADLPSIVALMNAAFRGVSAVPGWKGPGWSVETEFITGSRITLSLLLEEIETGAQFLVAKHDGALHGCVSLHAHSAGRWYLGSLTVDPALQNSGFGRKLLLSAEEYALAHDASTIEMTVVNIRHALIAWYVRRGYQPTGDTRSFPYDDNRFGIPTRPDLEFVVLEKDLRAAAQQKK
jgi:ribosomal protein S18 acetylase RimI-like enzyme